MKTKVLSVVIGAATMMGVGSAFAASQLKVNFGGDAAEPKAASAADAGSSADIVKVKARGVGANKDEALKDAYRDAVERAIGLYVDAEQMVKNDEVVQDQVLTHSNAYITHYEEVDTKPLSGGLVQVRIVADVKKGQLTKKLEGVMPPQTVKVNGGILNDAYAQIVSKEKRAGDSAALLKAALKDCDPVKSLIVAGVRADSQKLLTSDLAKAKGISLSADKIMLFYLFELKFDREKYFRNFVPHLKKTLSQISLTKPKEVRLTKWAPSDLAEKAAVDFCKGETRERTYLNPIFYHGLGDGAFWPLAHYSYALGGKSYLWNVGNGEFTPTGGRITDVVKMVPSQGSIGSYPVGKIDVAMITQLNAGGEMGKATLFELEGSLLPIVDEWLMDVGGCVKNSPLEKRKTIYNIVFADKDGEELAAYPWEVADNCLANVCGTTVSSSPALRDENGAVFISPFLACFGENYLEWKSFVLDRELLKKIDTIKIELAE